MTQRILSLLTIAGLLCATHCAAQTVFDLNGQVIDGATGVPLVAASIVAQNSTYGTVSDSAGVFHLQLAEGGYTISVSYTGYQTKEIRVNKQIASEDLYVALVPKAGTLQEISVPFDLEVKNGWEVYGDIFVKNFIGQTYFSKACVIKNPQVLRFYYFKRRRTLKVTSKEPLIVENYALGYQLTFAIDSLVNNFETRTSMFIGNPLFEEMDGTPEQEILWSRNRREIYYGSALHFMRSLYEKKLQQDGYELKFIFKTPTEEIPVTVRDVYSALHYSKDSVGTIHLAPVESEVAVIYHRARPEVEYLMLEPSANKNFQISTFVFDPKAPISVEKNGYYYPQEGLITNGYLGFKKIADMLPYDYMP